jgi:hypothetical protein
MKPDVTHPLATTVGAVVFLALVVAGLVFGGRAEVAGCQYITVAGMVLRYVNPCRRGPQPRRRPDLPPTPLLVEVTTILGIPLLPPFPYKPPRRGSFG